MDLVAMPASGRCTGSRRHFRANAPHGDSRQPAATTRACSSPRSIQCRIAPYAGGRKTRGGLSNLVGRNHAACLGVIAYIRCGSDAIGREIRFFHGNPLLYKALQLSFSIPRQNALPLRLRRNAEKHAQGIRNARLRMQAICPFHYGQRRIRQGNCLA